MASEIDSINLQNGGVSLDIPLASLPPVAGGKLSYTLSAHYNSKLLVKYSTETEGTTGPPMQCPGTYSKAEYFLTNPHGGWRIGGGYSIDFRPATEDYAYLSNVCHPTYPGYFFRPVLITPDGSEHEMRIYGSYDMGGPTDSLAYYKAPSVFQIITSPTRFYTVDGTYLTAIVNPSGYSTAFTIYMKDGTKIEQIGAVQKMTDTNGNSIELGYDATGNFNYAKDTYSGRMIKWSTTLSNSYPTTTEVQYQSTDGNWQTVTVNWGTTQILGKVFWRQGWNMNTDMPCLIQDTLIVSAMPVVRQIIFPQTESYAPPEYVFEYNSDTVYSSTISNYLESCTMSSYSYTRDVSKGLGEVSKVTTPSGAEINYKYLSDDQHSFADEYYGGSDNYYLMKNSVVEKSIEHDGTTDTWTYSIDNGGTVTNPDGSTYTEEYHPFDPYYTWLHGLDGLGGLQVKAIQQGRIMTEKHWTNLGGYLLALGSTAPVQQSAFNPVVDTEYTTLLDENGNRVKMTAKTFDYDYNGDLKTTTEYDWINLANVTYTNNNNSVTGIPTGIPSGTAVLRVTNNTYYNTASTSSDSTAYHKRSLSSPLDILGKLKESTVGTSTTVKSDTKFSYDGQAWGTAPSLGNLTKVSAYNDVTSSWIDTITTYTSKGNVATVTDPNGNVTQMTYDSIGGYTDLYPTQTVQAYGTSIARTTSATYDFYTGLVNSATDNDNSVTNSTEYDILGRPTKVISADGSALEAWTVTEYHDHDRYVVVRSDLETVGDRRKVATQFYDQLGRVRLSKTLEDAATQSATNETDGIKVETRYKIENGYTYQISSNPYRADYSSNETDPTMGWTRSKAWSDGRRQEVETFSGSSLPAPWGSNSNSTGVVTTDTDANATTVSDQAGKLRRSLTNALGQLIRVDEPNASNQLGTLASPNQPTYYYYNSLGNMVHVQQGVQHRYFMHDSLGRLMRVRQPEQVVNSALNTSGNPDNNSWTIGFTHDNNGNVLTSRDANNVVITRTYDALNRQLTRSYSDSTPTVNYTYDDGQVAFSKGKLTKVSSSVSEMRYTGYDQAGRLVASAQATDGEVYSSSYKYNLAGILIEQTYPSGRVVQNILKSDGDISIIRSRKNQNSGYWNYAESFLYTASGVIQHLRLGNGLWESAVMNSRNQVLELRMGNSATDASRMHLSYDYGEFDQNGNVDTTKNAGNIVRQTSDFSGLANPFVQNYRYDSLDRITEAKETVNGTQTWIQNFGYDRYGNRTSHSETMLGQSKPIDETTLPSVDPNTNKFSSTPDYGFDAVGNLIRDAAGRAFTFNGDNKQVRVEDSQSNTLGEYLYDGLEKRIKKITSSETIVFVYDGFGKLIAEYSTAGPPQDPKVSYTATDPIGSPRVLTNESGNIVSRRDFMPFGEEIQADTTYRTAALKYGVGDNVRQKFTGYERDEETGLDFAEARYYFNNHGRFTAVDPLLASGKSANPQTFNRYVYTMNRPLILTDPEGLQAATDPNTNESKIESWAPRTSGPNTVGNSTTELSRKEAATLGPKNNPKGGFLNMNVDITFKDGIKPSDYSSERAVIYTTDMPAADIGKQRLSGGRQGGDENPDESETAVNGQTKTVQDNPGATTAQKSETGMLVPQSKGALRNGSYTAIFVQGERNNKTGKLDSGVLCFKVEIKYDAKGNVDASRSTVTKISEREFLTSVNKKELTDPRQLLRPSK